jgi:hypothetical protein
LILSLCLVLGIFQVLPNFYLDVLLVIPFFVFGLKSIFNSPQFLPMKAGIECAALCDFLFFVVKSIFQQSYPISTYESLRCAALVPFLFWS